MMESNNFLLHMEDVTKSYDRCVLRDIDLRVRSGEFCTLVGPSGCGKSTLLRLVLGQEQPTSGSLLVEGRPIAYPGPERGIVYQRYSLFPHLTVLENIMLGKQLPFGYLSRLRRKKQAREEALFYLEGVKLAEHADKYPHELSGGMQQRVAIAQALITQPKILLMDEPFGALDPGTREDMQILILKLWEEHKMTVFFVTHDLEEAVYLGTRLLVLSQYYAEGDDRDDGQCGAQIVADYSIRAALSTKVKETAEFGKLIQQVRHEGFDPEYLQRVETFNLAHEDSFKTYNGGLLVGKSGER